MLQAEIVNRLRRFGADSISDAELLAAILCLLDENPDGAAVAERLLQRFKAFSMVLAAEPELLAEVEGLGGGAISRLKLIVAAAQRFAHDQLPVGQPVLGSTHSLLEYLRICMAFESREQLRVLFLDRKNRLIADEVHVQGTVDFVPVMAREIIRRAVLHSASALLLAHNHPTGDPAPTTQDVHLTRQVMSAGQGLGIVVLDHLIVGRFGHVSLRQLKVLRP